MVSETRKESMAWMEHGSQISLKRHALSMENELAAGAVEKLNYIVSKEYENNVALWQLTKYQEFTNPYFNFPISRILCLFWATLLLCECASAQYSIGEAFYLPRKDLLGTFTGGASIFQEIPKECIMEHKQRMTRNDKSFYENTESFYSSMAVSSSISASLKGKFTMGFSLSSASKSTSSGSVDVAGSSINVYTLTDYYQISKNCLNNVQFSKEFEKDFGRLPTDIKDPSKRSHWVDYDTFLKTYGSHVLKTVHRGSRMVQWTFAKKTTKYSEEEFTLKACIDLAQVPTQAGLLNVNACGGYSKEEIQRASRMSTSKKLTLLGGTTETRSVLQQKRTPELIAQFLREADTHPSPAIYKFESIWNVLKGRFIGERNASFVRALNLEAYYEGMLDFGCERQAHGSVVLRKFIRTSSGQLPYYACSIPPRGCQDDDDCSIGGAGSVCYCYGGSCLDRQSVSEFSSKIKEKRVIRRSQSGSYDSGINNSCYYAVPVKCDCKTYWGGGWKNIWPTGEKLEDEEVLWDVHEKFLKRGKSYDSCIWIFFI